MEQKNQTCNHNFVSIKETVAHTETLDDWEDTVRIVIYCTKCGKVTYDQKE